jgi:hypothetical protein
MLLFEVFARKFKNISRHDQMLYLARAFEDVHDLAVAHPFFSEMFR